MDTQYEALKEEIIQDVLAKKLKCSEAARELGVTVRTVQNYVRRFLERGPEGLRDRRRGNHRKLSLSEETAIIAFKQERPERSARCIRDRLGLKVSEEAVRLILVKHHMNGKNGKDFFGTDERSNLDQNLHTPLT